MKRERRNNYSFSSFFEKFTTLIMKRFDEGNGWVMPGRGGSAPTIHNSLMVERRPEMVP
jgi:hypothetical protein